MDINEYLVVEKVGKWRRFYGSKVDPRRVAEICRRCRLESSRDNRPSIIAMNCWKIVAAFEPEKRGLVESWLIDAARFYEMLTGELSDDNVLIIYFQNGWKDMWSFREYMIKEWCRRDILPVNNRYFIPYRRGGSYYDPEFGSWRFWGKNYYSDRIDYDKAQVLKAECPHDGAILEWRGSKMICPLCGLKVPLGVVYEVLENGIAEYEVRTGARAGEIYRVSLADERLNIVRVEPCREG